MRTDLPPTGTAMHMIFGRRGFFGYAVRPDGENYWFSNIGQKEEPAHGVVAEGDYRDQLLATHGGDPSEVMRILQAVSEKIGAWPDYDIPPLPAWHRGRVCLLGDAAHARRSSSIATTSKRKRGERRRERVSSTKVICT